ncbi:glycosyltransferase family 31 protein [Daldinia caldariorum]|uniref:glycosyltransferase family 31 protein n=1 Tax=Daldinia caldariorum TaxID=326644 RepID=UPI0020075C88|nr:glycosyltransferase family 31 protein [Daldinia caldariorum]KAI1471116.1 glycosyltransferase family 31 protein [Daldinia caldariorum]
MFSIIPSFSIRSGYRVLAAILVFLILQQYLSFRKPASLSPTYPDGNDASSSLACDSLEGLNDLFVILRTGASEAPKKLPVHFSTTLRCVPHYVIYSDYEEDIEGYHVYNALDEMNPDIVATHPDFEYYRRLQEKGREAFSPEELAQWSAAKNTKGGRDSPGWRLDKWKFLPLADKAFRERPDAKWYIFIESDTYMLWQSFLEWLSHFDPSKPHYLGMQMQIGDVIFAYGGAGFAISNPALKKAVAHRNENLQAYDDFTGSHWAGDCVLGKVLADTDVNLLWSFPTLAGDQPADMNFNSTFGGSNKKPWCYYATSYHHLPSSEYHKLAKFEQAWKRENGTLPRHGDVFRNYVLPNFSSKLSDWDNLSDVDQGSVASFDECRSICEKQFDCIQFSLSDQSCKTSTALMLGHRISKDATPRVTSGWIMEKVKEYPEQMDDSCDNQSWILS